MKKIINFPVKDKEFVMVRQEINMQNIIKQWEEEDTSMLDEALYEFEKQLAEAK